MGVEGVEGVELNLASSEDGVGVPAGVAGRGMSMAVEALSEVIEAELPLGEAPEEAVVVEDEEADVVDVTARGAAAIAAMAEAAAAAPFFVLEASSAAIRNVGSIGGSGVCIGNLTDKSESCQRRSMSHSFHLL